MENSLQIREKFSGFYTGIQNEEKCPLWFGKPQFHRHYCPITWGKGGGRLEGGTVKSDSRDQSPYLPLHRRFSEIHENIRKRQSICARKEMKQLQRKNL